jgi:hypothetical protein
MDKQKRNQQTDGYEEFTENEQQALSHILEVGEEHGSITFDDILTYLPDAEESLPLIEHIYETLSSAGVEMLGFEKLEAEASPDGNGHHAE